MRGWVERKPRVLAMENEREEWEKREKEWSRFWGEKSQTRILNAAKTSTNEIKTRVKIWHRKRNPLERIGWSARAARSREPSQISQNFQPNARLGQIWGVRLE